MPVLRFSIVSIGLIALTCAVRSQRPIRSRIPSKNDANFGVLVWGESDWKMAEFRP